jgi:hypothetical protein
MLLAFFWLVLPLLIAIGRMGLNRLRRSQFRDEDIDRMINTALERGQELAHRRVFGPHANLADVVGVVALYVPYVERQSPTPAVPKEDMLARRGKDRMLRFGAYRFVFMYPTLNYLAVFTTQYNLITDAIDDQGHEIEYPYRHIVSIESGLEHGEFKEKGVKHERSLIVGQWFKIVNTGGERFTVGVRYADLDVVLPGERFAKIAVKGGRIEGLEALEARLTDARKRIRDILRQREEAAAGASAQSWGPPAGGSGLSV